MITREQVEEAINVLTALKDSVEFTLEKSDDEDERGILTDVRISIECCIDQLEPLT